MQKLHTTKIQLTAGDKVNRFVQIASRCAFPIFLCSGRYRINGKSLIGIFSLDLTKSIRMEVQCTEEQAEELFAQMHEFLVAPPTSADAKADAPEEEPGKRSGLFGVLFGKK